MALFLYTFAFIFLIWIIYRWYCQPYVRLAQQVPSYKLHTFLCWGKIPSRAEGLLHLYENGKKFGSNGVLWIGPWPLYLTIDPNILKEILTSKNCIDKPAAAYNGFTSVFGPGLITENEPTWSQHRKILNRAFTPKNLSSFFSIFHKEIDKVIEQIQLSLDKGEDIDMLLIFRELTLKNGSKTTIKRDLEKTEFNSYDMSKHASGILEFAANACLNQILGLKWICKLAEITIYRNARSGLKIFRRLINETTDILQKNTITDPSILPEIHSALDQALQGDQQKTFTRKEIEGQMFHLFIGAFETTSTTMYMTISMLAMHPQYQKRIYEEIINTLPLDDKEITLNMIDQLTFLDMVINETMRLFPVIPMILRKVTNEDLSLSNGLTLPKGQIICIDLFRLHRSEKIYGPHADKFNPDNFLPSNVADRHPYSFLPFTKGQRFCIVKLMCCNLFKMGLILFAVVSLVFLWIINRWNSRSFVSLAYKLPSNRLHTLLGWGKILTGKDILSCMYEHGKKYGPNSIFWMGPWTFLLSSDPQVIKEILTSKYCLDKPSLIYNGLSTIGGEGLISESEPMWGRHRKLLNRAFSNKVIYSFFPIFHREINSLIKRIGISIEKREDIDMLVILRELTLKNATQTTLKRNLDLTKYNTSSLSKQFEGILEFVCDICLNKILIIDWIRYLAEIYIYKTAREGVSIFRKLINESLDIVKNHDITDPSYLPEVQSVLDYALDGVQQHNLELNEIEGQINQLFTAAFETTSTTLFLALTMLAMYPEYQDRAYEEILGVLGDNDDEIISEQIDQLTYLELVFNETMRIMPIVPMVFRKVSKEDITLSNGWTLPVGQIICIDIFRLHRSKEVWGPQADVFNPDNFLPSNVATRHPFSFIPFTKGQRFCIGWKYAMLFSKITLAKLIKTYKFSTDFKFEELSFTNHITLKLVEEPQLHLEKR
ncbi:putative cytochrome P450 313a4 [Lucilia cuprina]|uniref:Putative cytochrome P450 313a4 n=1 Tax=Lucilia cuprina TaxID=7375 RepID=A0A0L0BRY3_LUCCU|nr:putative cytochrome P450 313a4 [Lucilia cuprina]